MDRYIVVSNVDAIEKDYPEAKHLGTDLWNDMFWCLYETDGEDPVRLVATDRLEPEDGSFVRDLSWVVEELNRAHNEPQPSRFPR